MDDSLIRGMLLEILDISSIFPTDFFDVVNGSLEGYLGGNVLKEVEQVMSGTIFAIGASLLTLFMMIELVALVNRYNSDGGITGVRLPMNIMLKFGIYAFLYCNLGKIMKGIQSIAVQISTGINNTKITLNTSELKTITDTVTSMGMLEKICAFILILVIFCLTQILIIVIKTIVYFRIFELFLTYMFAPIPLATVVNQEFRSVAFNYLKSFTAVCLQSAIILGSFKLYNIIIVGSIPTGEAVAKSCTTTWDIFLNILLPISTYLVVLAAAVFSSGRISKSIVNAV